MPTGDGRDQRGAAPTGGGVLTFGAGGSRPARAALAGEARTSVQADSLVLARVAAAVVDACLTTTKK